MAAVTDCRINAPETGVLYKKQPKIIKTDHPVRADDRMVLAGTLYSWSGSDRHSIKAPNHERLLQGTGLSENLAPCGNSFTGRYLTVILL